jgi:hypothetical protein
MFLEDGTRTHFMTWLQREFPALVPRYERLYRKKYAPDDYRKQIKGMIRVLQERYGVKGRESDHDQPIAPHQEPEQVGFAW